MAVHLLSTLLIAAFCLRPSSIQAKEFQYCDKTGDYDVKVEGLEMSPDPVVRGKPAIFSIAASTGKAISGGQLLIEVSYLGVHVHSEKHDLCGKTSCPVVAGNFVISHTQTLPGFTPPGPYMLKMKMFDKSKHQLTCIAFNFKIKAGSSVSDS